MQNKTQKTIFSIIFFVVLFFIFSTTYAQEYTLLAPLPGTATAGPCPSTGCTTTLSTYLPAIFNLAIGIAAVLAFIMITWGGITYATSDAISGKADGKRWIEDALWGLLLVIGAWVILYTINPKILNFNLELQRPDVKEGESWLQEGRPLDAAGLANDSVVREGLAGQIGVNNPPCVAGRTRGCTNVDNLPGNAINGLLDIKKECGECSVVITGGTEGGHATHGPGIPIVDLRPTEGLNKYVWGSTSNPQKEITMIKNLENGQRATFTYEVLGGNARGTSTGNHWHVTIR